MDELDEGTKENDDKFENTNIYFKTLGRVQVKDEQTWIRV